MGNVAEHVGKHPPNSWQCSPKSDPSQCSAATLHLAHKGIWRCDSKRGQTHLCGRRRLICRVTRINESRDSDKGWRGDRIKINWGRWKERGRGGWRRRKKGKRTRVHMRILSCVCWAALLCSRLRCGTYYWCRRKFGPTGNKAASCPAPLREYHRGMASSSSGSDHRGPAPGVTRGVWGPMAEPHT